MGCEFCTLVDLMEARERCDPEAACVEPDRLAPEEIREQPAVQEALKEAAKPAETEKHRRRIPQAVVLGAVALLLGAAYLLLDLEMVLPDLRGTGWHRAILAGFLVVGLLAVHATAKAVILPRTRSRATAYNIRRVLNLTVFLLILFSTISVFYVGWYGAAVSLGLLSLLLGFALQAPITSFFAWIYLLARAPYRVGDRIRIGDSTGDVIDVGYLDTTLWEFGGELLSTDHPSGRIIRFPNSAVFNSPVFNYSWPLFPYIWNEVTVQVAYQSDLEFVAKVMTETAEEELGPRMEERVFTYRELLAKTPVDHLEVAERPTVIFRVNPVTWVDATVRYLVAPRNAGRRKTALTKKIIERLNAAPDRVMFPAANTR
jgi:small-conductance mechanosensitive channel